MRPLKAYELSSLKCPCVCVRVSQTRLMSSSYLISPLVSNFSRREECFKGPLCHGISGRLLCANQIQWHPLLRELRRREFRERVSRPLALAGQRGGGEKAPEDWERGEWESYARFNCQCDNHFNCFSVCRTAVITPPGSLSLCLLWTEIHRLCL